MSNNIIKKYDDLYDKYSELQEYNKMIPENKQFIADGDIIKYINFDDKNEKIKTAFIIKKLNNKLLLKSFNTEVNFVWYIWLKNNYIFYKSKNNLKNYFITQYLLKNETNKNNV